MSGKELLEDFVQSIINWEQHNGLIKNPSVSHSHRLSTSPALFPSAFQFPFPFKTQKSFDFRTSLRLFQLEKGGDAEIS